MPSGNRFGHRFAATKPSLRHREFFPYNLMDTILVRKETGAMTKTKVLIVDDEPAIREVLEMI